MVDVGINPSLTSLTDACLDVKLVYFEVDFNALFQTPLANTYRVPIIIYYFAFFSKAKLAIKPDFEKKGQSFFADTLNSFYFDDDAAISLRNFRINY